MSFHKKDTEKIELVARPEVDSLRASETADLPAAISNYPLHLKQEERSSVCCNATWKHSTIKINGSMFQWLRNGFDNFDTEGWRPDYKMVLHFVGVY